MRVTVAASRFQRSALPVILLAAMTLLAYGPALRGGFVWDDEHHVTDLPALRSVEGLRDIWLKPGTTLQYYPLTFTSFWLQYRLWGLDPFGFHAVNVALHLANALLLLALFRRFAVRGAWFAAALFALHPVNTMSVAWVTELKNVQSLFLALVALHAYVRWAGLPTGASRPGAWYAAALVCFAAALCTKTATALLAIALVLVIWLARGRLARRDWIALVPFLVLGAAAGTATLWLERGFVGASGGVFDLTPAERALHAGRAFWVYLGNLAWPHPLMFFYPVWTLDARMWSAWLAPAAALLALAICWHRRRRWGPAPFAALLFFALSAPALVLVQTLYMMQFTPVANHWIYFGAPAVFALAAHAAATAAARHPTRQRALRVLAALVLLAYLPLDWREGAQYRNAETLYAETLRRNPASFIAAYNLGNARAAEGRFDEARALYEQALRSKPDYHVARVNYASVLASLGESERSLAEFRLVLAETPASARAHHNLGLLLAELGDPAAGVIHLREAARLDPADADFRHNLGAVLAALGETEEALRHFRYVVDRHPDSVPDLLHLAGYCADLGRPADARHLYERVLALDPGNTDARAALARP